MEIQNYFFKERNLQNALIQSISCEANNDENNLPLIQYTNGKCITKTSRNIVDLLYLISNFIINI